MMNYNSNSIQIYNEDIKNRLLPITDSAQRSSQTILENYNAMVGMVFVTFWIPRIIFDINVKFLEILKSLI